MNEIRDKYNKYIGNELRDKISNLNIVIGNFNNIKYTHNLGICTALEKLYRVLPYKEEEISFLNKIINSIKKLDLNSIITLCDDYEFRFFKIYDYLIDNLSQKFFDYHLASLFIDVLLNTHTVNGVNLSLFILSFFNPTGLCELYIDNLQEDMDYLEIGSFVILDRNIISNEYFLVLNLFYSGKKINYLLNEFGRNCSISLGLLSFVFYLYEIDFYNLNDNNGIEDLKVLRYLNNLRRKLNLVFKKNIFSNKFIYLELFKKVEAVISNFKHLVMGKEVYIDIEYIRIYLELVGTGNKFFNNEVQDFIKKELINSIGYFNIKKCKDIFTIYDMLNINISDIINELIIENYDNVTFADLLFRSIREYRYGIDIVRYFENTFYFNKLIYNRKIITTVLRVLVLIYEKNQSVSDVGLRIVRSVINDKHLYLTYSDYVKYFAIKIIERG